MRGFLSPCLSVARVTIREGLQQPALLLLVLVCAECCALQPVLQLHTFGEPGRLVRDGGLALLLVCGTILSACLAGSAVSSELRSGTAGATLARPMSRACFLVGKWLGVCGAAAVFTWILGWTILLAQRTAEAPVQTASTASSVRDALCGVLSCGAPPLALAAAAVLNHRAGRRLGLWFHGLLSAALPLAAVLLGFVERDGTRLQVGFWNPALSSGTVAALAPLFFLLCVFAAVAVAFATRLATGPAVVLTIALLFGGVVLPGAPGVAGAVGALLPDVATFWPGEALSAGASLRPLVAGAALHAFSYAVFALAAATASFDRRDL